MKAFVDREACIGCELCVSISPEVFEMDDESIAVVAVDPVPANSETSARDAANSCPTDAISIEE